MDFLRNLVRLFVASTLSLSMVALATPVQAIDVSSPYVQPDLLTEPQEKQLYVDHKASSNDFSVHIDNENYFWVSDDNSSGLQTVIPLTITYKKGNIYAGLRTVWIYSENTTAGRRGHVSTISDTDFSFAYVMPLSNGWSIRYNLDYNLPTGKETLNGSEKNAIMDGNLVQQIRFGEGHNFTPGVVVTKTISNNVVIGLGASHTFRGSFDPNGDFENDELNPGDETRLSFQGQYSRNNLLLIGGVIYTTSQHTYLDEVRYYRKGDLFEYNFTGVYLFPKSQCLTVSGRYSKQNPDYYTDYITGNYEKESRNINGSSFYVMCDYAKMWQDKYTFHLYADWLKISANSYDQINDLYNAGRERWQVGVGYDQQVSKNMRFSLALKKAVMYDKATPATLVDARYDGLNLSCGLNYQF